MKSIIFKDNEDIIDGWIDVNDKEAIEAMKGLWRKGYTVGTSSGLNYAASRKLAKEINNAVIATLFPAVNARAKARR